MKIFILVGEASGDLQGALLAKRLREQSPDIELVGWGGDRMMAEGVQVLKHITELDFMGFVEVVKHLPEIRKNFSLCKKQIHEHQPDLVLLVDYPGFNLRMTKWCKNQGFKTCYYISPQVWAWKENRVKSIKKYVDKMICILPFEKDFYKKYEMEVDYVGHPLVEIVDQASEEYASTPTEYIALLPGSRSQEVGFNLPKMLEVSYAYRDRYKIAVAKSPTLEAEKYKEILQKYPEVELYTAGTYPLLRSSAAAMVTSGTATLETALFRVPQMVCYRATSVSVALARYFIRVSYISLVNLIMDEEIVKEYIQKDFNTENTSQELDKLLDRSNTYTQNLLDNYDGLRKKLTQEEKPSVLAAKLVLSMM